MDSIAAFTRVVHIVVGVFWTGAALTVVGFVLPTVKALGPEGGPFMQRFAGKSGFAPVMVAAAWITTLTGLFLMQRLWAGLGSDLAASPGGQVLLIGVVAGVIAFLIGIFFQGPNAKRLEKIGLDLAKAGGPPSPEQAAQMAMLGRRLAIGGMVAALFLVLSVIGMALEHVL